MLAIICSGFAAFFCSCSSHDFAATGSVFFVIQPLEMLDSMCSSLSKWLGLRPAFLRAFSTALRTCSSLSFNGDVVFRLNNFFGNAFAVNSDGVHRSYLHSNVATYVEFNAFLVEAMIVESLLPRWL